MNCQNCSAKLNCSCKVKIASDGKSCCVLCVQNYEMTKKGKPSPDNFQGSPPPKLNNSITPKIESITFNNIND